MAVRFSDEQVIQATGARRLRAGGRASYEGVCTDTRSLTPGCLFVALKGERFDAHDFLAQAAAQAGGAVVRKGATLPSDLPPGLALFEVEDTLRALGALAHFHRLRFRVPIGAITGSNGKTTTKEMVAAILETRGPALRTQGNLNNEVGVPLTLFGLGPSHIAAVVEMGLNHEGELSYLTSITEPDAGLITVVQPAHLLGLGSIDGVARAKGELFRGLSRRATAVVNLDDRRVAAQAAGLDVQRLTYGRDARAEVRLAEVETLGRSGLRVAITHAGRTHSATLGFFGEHNAMNATGAFALGLALGYSPEACVQGLQVAKPYARRLNVLEVAAQGFTVLDDCYNANPASMKAALQTAEGLAVGGRAVAVLGDMLELGADEAAEHRVLGEQTAQHARLAAFFGPRSAEAYAAAHARGLPAAHFTEVEPLLAWLKPQLLPKDVVLVKASRSMRLERVVSALTGAAEGAH